MVLIKKIIQCQIDSPNKGDNFMSALEDKVKKESRYKIRKGYNIEQDSSPNPKNLLTFPLSMKVSRLKVYHKKHTYLVPLNVKWSFFLPLCYVIQNYLNLIQIEAKNKTNIVDVAEWSTETGYKQETNYVKEIFPRFFRIGTVFFMIR